MGSNSITMYRGDDRTLTLTFTDSNSTAIDITGYTIFFTVKEYFSDTDANAKISKTITSHSNPTGGVTLVNIDPADTSSLTPGSYKYDVQIKDGSGTITTVVQDDFIISPDVTTRTS